MEIDRSRDKRGKMKQTLLPDRFIPNGPQNLHSWGIDISCVQKSVFVHHQQIYVTPHS